MQKALPVNDQSVIDTHVTGAARRLLPRLWLLVWIGLALLIAGMLAPAPAAALALTVASAAMFGVAMLAIGLNRRHLSSHRHFHESLDLFVAADASPVLLADESGVITYQNRAARNRYGPALGDSLVLLLGAQAANPVNLLFRLQQRALNGRPAREDVVTHQGHMRLTAISLGTQGFVWRLEEMTERPAPGADSTRPVAMPMLLTDENGRVLHMNRAARVLTGCAISHIDRLFHDLPLRPHGLHRITGARGAELVRVVEHRHGDGRRELFLVPCSESELAGASTQRLFDEIPVALLKLAVDGRILHANRLARGLLGYAGDRPLGLGDLVQGLGRPVSDWLRDAAEGRVGPRAEVVQASGREDESYLQIALSPITEDGETSLIAVLQDATELKTLEAQFVQSQKMQAIGQLAGGVAHDFNNLLTAISGYCDLLLMRRDESDPDFGDLTQIAQNANRAASLVSQLLAFSRKQNLQPELLDLREMLPDLSHLLNRLLGEKVVLNLQSAADLAAVKADRRQLEQVLMNLVVNARDAMPGGGEVGINAENLHLDEPLIRDRARVAPGEYVSITVSDSGCGIPADRLGKIFEPFFTTKKTGEGTGLGLSMAYGIVKQTGGFIFVDSAPGQGTRFQILLPAHAAAPTDGADIAGAADAAAPAGELPGREEGVVLLVEDESPVRTFASRALTMRGYQVIEAESGEAALDILQDPDLHVDVFVTDVIMPGLDGPSWVREALRRRPEVRVVFVSGYAEESVAGQQAGIPGATFLPKPFSLGDLAEKVREQAG